MRSLAALSLLFAAATPAAGQTQKQVEARYSADFNACMASGDAARGVTSGMMDCLGTEIDRQDARLNQAYKMVSMRLKPAQRLALRDSERRWITRRDSGCKRSAEASGGGTASALVYSGCILDETIKRTMWLETYRP